MEWINDLIWGSGIGHSILLLSVVIAAGIQLGKIKVFGISLGITLVLFVGILLGHFGLTIDHSVLHFFKEFGLILFVYSVGMQVGPGFFSSFRKGGITLNLEMLFPNTAGFFTISEIAVVPECPSSCSMAFASSLTTM